jgi:hypothetical protein
MKELLIKLRNYCLALEEDKENPKEWMYCSGLCAAVIKMNLTALLNNKDTDNLLHYIKNHRPKWYQKHYSWSQRHSGFYWPSYLWLPRILWLNDQIYKLK